MSEEERRYYDSEAKRKWDKEHTVMFSVKFFDTPASDRDIIEYLRANVTKDRSKSQIIKEALREKIAREKAGK